MSVPKNRSYTIDSRNKGENRKKTQTKKTTFRRDRDPQYSRNGGIASKGGQGWDRSSRDHSQRVDRVRETFKREINLESRPKKVALQRPEHHFVMGRNAVLETLRYNRDRCVRLFFVDTDDYRVAEALQISSKFQIEQISVTAQALTAGVNSESHQGIVLEVLPYCKLSLEELCLEAEASPLKPSILVAVDGVTDPQNVGAILRACECFGVRALIFSLNRVAPITPTVTKASAGASELVSMVPVANLAQALDRLKRSGYWTLATTLDGDAQPVSKAKLPEKIVLVLGSEGKGIQRLVRERADFAVFIPMMGKLDSLNVSQAAATFLYEISRQMHII